MSETVRHEETLVQRIDERISIYERQHGCSERAALPFDSSDHVYVAIGLIDQSNWPLSAYLVLKAIAWMMSHECQPEGWWSEMGVLLNVLSVYDDEAAAKAYARWVRLFGEEQADRWKQETAEEAVAWSAEVRGWPTEDRRLIRDWLAVVTHWECVQACFPDDAQAAMSFWTQLAGTENETGSTD